MTTRISHSRLKAWRRCRKFYDYRYVQRLDPKKVQRPLVFGRTVHKIIEHQIIGRSQEEAVEEINKDRRNLFTADQEDWDGIVRDATDLMTAYLQFYRDDKLDFVELEGKRAEHKFEFDLGEGILLTGVIDAIPITPDGRVWVEEHKSHKVIPTEDVRMSDLQTMIYAHILKVHFKVKRVSGVLWDYIRSKTPAVPELLKNGMLSKKRIDTLPHVYERAIVRHGLNRADYVDILGELDDKLSSWFKRSQLPLNQDAIDSLMEETRITAREIRRKAGVDTTRNISRDCSYCPYQRLCQAELFGMDSDFIREREFRERPERETQ